MLHIMFFICVQPYVYSLSLKKPEESLYIILNRGKNKKKTTLFQPYAFPALVLLIECMFILLYMSTLCKHTTLISNVDKIK